MIAPGTVLQNRYLVERQIGQGGMGAVYVATDRRFGSTVAIKETLFDDPSLRRAFEREARLLNRLRHAALPRVSDHFGEGTGQFLVMEYIEGSDLSDLLKDRGAPFVARDVLNWADQLLDALDYLHTQESPVVHRDIKPQNLKLLPRNQVVLLDFGLAKGTPLQTRVTATGSLFGYSFNYAPIEQMQGAGTDPRSDLYSLGATLYHLLTGATPPDALTRATAVLNGDPDPLRPASEVNPHVPPSVAAALARAMALSAAGRFGSAGEMRAALKEADLAGAGPEGAAPTVTGASEQETRLMNAGGAAPTAHAGPGARETGVAGSRDAATLVNTEVAGGATLVGARKPGDASVVTEVGRSHTAAGGSGSRRTLGVAAGVVAAALVGVAVYSFARGGSAPTGDSLQPVPAPSAEAPSAQPTPAAAETQPTDAPAPTPEPSPAATQPPAPPRRAAAASREKQQSGTPAGAGGAAAGRPAPHAPQELDEAAPDPMEEAFRNRDWANRPLSEEEIQAIMRRTEERRRRAQQMRRRVLREQRRNTPPPPPPVYPRP